MFLILQGRAQKIFKIRRDCSRSRLQKKLLLEGIDVDELQLDHCDYDDDPEVFVEEQEDELVSGGFERIPNTELKDVTPEQRETLNKLTDLLENDDDVTNVYNLLKPAEE